MEVIDRFAFYIKIGTFLMTVIFLSLVCVYVLYLKQNQGVHDTHLQDEKAPVEAAERMVPIDDIADDMIIMSGRKRFLAILKCKGFDFYTSSMEEQIRCKNNYSSFIRNTQGTMTYRIYGEDVNLDHTMEMYQVHYQKLQEDLFDATEHYRDMMDYGSGNDENVQDMKLSLQRKIKGYQWRLQHMESEMRYLRGVSSSSIGQQRLVQTYVLEWQNEDELISGFLDDEMLYAKAIVELDKLCRARIRQLSDCGVSAYRCKNEDLIDICHRHYHPITGNQYTYDHLKQSTYFDFISATDTMDQMEAEFDDDLISSMQGGFFS